jgi:hypothetical protein
MVILNILLTDLISKATTLLIIFQEESMMFKSEIKKGCGVDKREIVLIDYPKFFTPNNDGYNEYWHILG